jgi:hypothetical protein
MGVTNLLPAFLTLTFLASESFGQKKDAKPPKEPKVVRPAIWWSGVGRISDGGGGGLKPTTDLITDAEAFAKLWKQVGFKGEVPRVNFKDYFVLADFRAFGLDFTLRGGLALDERGDARAVGLRADPDNMNSAIHSTTIGIFPRAGITSVGGKKFPVAAR